jgi:uncharacterized DUF497 family protein/uncharacterized protein (DUF4415 family)
VFDWDIPKAIANFEKHGVPFEEAATIFGDSDALDWEDVAHSHQEPRFKRLGSSVNNRLLWWCTRYGGSMKRKRSGSSALVKRVGRNVRHTPDSQIDFSDIPESTDEELRRARRVGRPTSGMAKQLIAIRLSPRLLNQLRKMAAKQGKPYQTLIHELLERAASHAA